MSDYYHHFLTSMAGVGGDPSLSQHGASIPVQQAPVLSLGTTPMSPAYQNLGGFFNGYAEPIMFSAPKAQRSRRKSAPGLDHIKHRRTRSGCYTCRSRRVKCDETHPVCERCRKGNRECVYPEPTPPKGSVKDSSGQSQQESPTSSRGDDDDDETGHDGSLTPIMDEDEEEEAESATMQSSTPTIPPTPLSAPATSLSFNHGSMNARQGLEGDVQFYLNYYRDNITHYHYSVVNDHDNFFQEMLTELAIQDEGLLYAVVGFAAYHYTLQSPIGEIKDFLHFYNRSVTLLLRFLKRKERHTEMTLLTILQLATIEEYLGDWVNLMGHQKAALEVLTELYTPQTVMQTVVGRMILTWYTRFDVFTGIMASSETMLPREWFTTFVDYYEARAAENPDELSYKTEVCSGRLRMISMEMSLLFGRSARHQVTEEEYTAEHRRLYNALHEWKNSWDPALVDPEFLVTDVSMNGASDTDRIFQPLTPGLLFRPPLFTSTILTCEWNSITLMHGSQGTSDPSSETLEKLREHAYVICQICEAVETWPLSPAGSLIILQPCLGIAALFVPQEEAYQLWIRKKFALLERMGYISPGTMRLRMAELFRDGSCLRWWLPNDEGFTPMLQSIRAFADERNAMAVSTQSENLRQIRSVFSRMNIRRAAMDQGEGQLSDGVNTMLLE
ncbi:uncharacterized protein B0T23DRAFT_213097 [Neurospora hispaniola]|uniref:Zn(2)-C6 fungal-type domain-containing protein n=1 Tax=Neurospora hispaniola TaxID=588809 RepID=A0AAJ0MND6_9PEZI|nr:hypothetical protein B0T23DRAFT_213097 [Neurospora hispaniola]